MSFRTPAKLVLALAITLTAAGSLVAEPPEPPPFYAIRDARVVTGAGETLERATVLIADGLIEAVGADLPIPADAWVVEGEGLTVFPGLVDAMTDLGIKKAEPSGGDGGGNPFASSGPTIRGPEDRPLTTPWVSAADLQGDDSRIEKWRQAGFGSAVSVPGGGIFPGSAAVIALGRQEPAHRVVAGPVAQRIDFDRSGGFRSFPGSLMGVISYVNQTLDDARHYGRVRALYAASPGGRERPAYDRALAPLEEAQAGRDLFLLPGILPREIDRALTLARGQALRAAVVGAHGGYARADELRAAGVPALVSLDWPEEPKDRDPDADTDFRTLYHRRMAPKTPAVLAAAGVPFALYSGGLASASEVFEGVRAAIDAGLTDDQALAALTSAPAAIFGVDDRLGTVEAGKIANLIVATDWPWAEEAEIEVVFVDGVKFEERESEEATEPPAADVSGTWALTMTTPRGSQELTAELEMSEDGKVTGTITGDNETPVDDGKMSGDLLRWKTTREMGGRSFTAAWSLTVEGETLSGSATAGPMSMEISGERTAKAAADDDAVADDDAEPSVSDDEMRAVMATMHGPVRPMGDFAVTNATVWTVSGETLEYGTVIVRDGKIAAVGTGIAVPEGIETIDAGGGALTPGIFDAHAHIAIEGGVNEGSLAVTAMVSVGDVINPDDIGIYRALAGGVTTANLLHGSANPIGGQNAVIKLRWGADAEGLKLAGAPAGIKFALGENPKRSNFRIPGGEQRYPATRMGVMDVIRRAFTEARAYQAEWRAYDEAMAARSDRGRRQPSGPEPMPPRRDLELEALVEILEGERLVHSHCYRADEILQLLRLAEEFGFRVATLQHVLEGYKVADEIAEHGAGASTFSDWWGYKVEAYDAIPGNAALMAERGVVVSINSDSGEEMRHLNQEAAKAIRWGGMDEIEALKLVTLNPAIQFGVDDRIGSIEPGKDADLVLWSDHPLSTQAVARKTWVDGDLYFDREADRERQAAIDEIKARLDPEDGADAEEGGAEEPAPGEPPGEEEPGSGSTPDEIIWQERPYSCREEVR